MKTLILDKVVPAGTEYTAESNKGMVIEKIGTDKATDVQVTIDGKELLKLRSDATPLHVVETNQLGPLDLRDIPLVVPPFYKFKFGGATTDKVRLRGKLILLDQGESFPSGYFSRFGEQHNRYFTVERGSFSLGATTAWAKDTENSIYSRRLEEFERLAFRHLFLLWDDPTNAFGEGKIGLRVYVDEEPIDVRDYTFSFKGWELYSCLVPIGAATELIPMDLAGQPIVLEPSHKIEFRLIANVDIAAHGTESCDICRTSLSLLWQPEPQLKRRGPLKPTS